MKPLVKRIGCYIFAIIFVLGGWYLTSLALHSPALPTPAETLPVFAQYAASMSTDFLISLYRLVVSIALGTAAGALCGWALGWFKCANELFAPVLYILYPLPKIVFLPILLALLGLGNAPKILIISLTIFFQVIVVMRDATLQIPRRVIENARTLGASKLFIFRHVIIPVTLPGLFTTLRVSSGIAIALLFFAESFAGSTGIGYFIMQSWSMVNYTRMFAGIVALALLGLAIYALFDIAERRATRWQKNAH